MKIMIETSYPYRILIPAELAGFIDRFQVVECEGYGAEQKLYRSPVGLDIRVVDDSIIGERRGKVSTEEAMDTIHDLLNGAEWSPNTLNLIADAVRATGRQVGDLEDEPDPKPIPSIEPAPPPFDPNADNDLPF